MEIIVQMGPEWKVAIEALKDKSWKLALEKHMAQAMHINAAILVKAVRRAVKEAESHGKRNAWLTVMIKGQDNPLVQTGDLHQSVGSVVHKWNRADIGVMGKVRSRKVIRYAQIVHDGTQYNVTRKMRSMFRMLHFVSINPKLAKNIRSARARKLWSLFRRNAKGQVWPLLKASTVKIVIPPRPYLEWAITRYDAIEVVAENFFVAVIRSIEIPNTGPILNYGGWA